MTEQEMEMADCLVRIFENVLITEEMSLQKGYFPDLSLAEMHALDAIGPYEARTMSETAAILGITTGTLTVAIDRLVRKGFVERNRDEKDRRIVRISLTRQGKVACRMHGKYHRVLARRALDPCNEEEAKLLLRMVHDVDEFLAFQAKKYNERESLRKTAKEVAKEERRRNDNG